MDYEDDDDWGIVSNDQLFCVAGTTKSLVTLVADLTSSGHFETHLDHFPIADNDASMEMIVDSIATDHDGHKRLQLSESENSESSSKKSILKKKVIVDSKQPSVKHVTFDVQKFAARESTGADRDDACDRLALQLGARPIKPKNVNYKLLKADRKRRKDNEAIAAKSRPIVKKKMKNKKIKKLSHREKRRSM
jgi:hypothetical protein